MVYPFRPSVVIRAERDCDKMVPFRGLVVDNMMDFRCRPANYAAERGDMIKMIFFGLCHWPIDENKLRKISPSAPTMPQVFQCRPLISIRKLFFRVPGWNIISVVFPVMRFSTVSRNRSSGIMGTGSRCAKSRFHRILMACLAASLRFCRFSGEFQFFPYFLKVFISA